MEKHTNGNGRVEVCKNTRGKLCQITDFALVSVTIFCMIYILAVSCLNEDIIPTVEARESLLSSDRKTHFLVEYYVDGQRYVRTLNMAIAKLVEGTAKDLKINPAHLLAMCIQEGSVPNPDGNYYACDPTAVGDNGQALGAFQIHTGYHDIKREDAKHMYYSARWTAERLLQKGYLHNKERAIRCHNSCRPDNDYGNRILQIAKTLKPIITNTF